MKNRQLDTSRDIEIKEGLGGLTPARISVLYRRAPLLRPIQDSQRLWTMFEKASLVLTAWNGARLVGIARVLTDGVMYSFICDLAVEPDVQGLGIGKRLIKGVMDRCEGTDVMLRSTLDLYHKHIGLKPLNDAWIVQYS